MRDKVLRHTAISRELDLDEELEKRGIHAVDVISIAYSEPDKDAWLVFYRRLDPVEAEPEGELRTFFAFEISTETGYLLFVDLNEGSRDMWLDIAARGMTESTDDIECDTCAMGTVQARSGEEAEVKIKAGDWEYSQRV